MPENLEEIGDFAFETSGISGALVIPNSVINIGDSAFSVTRITSITFGNGVRTIGDQAFQLCEDLEGELYIPDNVENIGIYAFDLNPGQTNKITSISISKNTKYEQYAFDDRPTPTIRP